MILGAHVAREDLLQLDGHLRGRLEALLRVMRERQGAAAPLGPGRRRGARGCRRGELRDPRAVSLLLDELAFLSKKTTTTQVPDHSVARALEQRSQVAPAQVREPVERELALGLLAIATVEKHGVHVRVEFQPARSCGTRARNRGSPPAPCARTSAARWTRRRPPPHRTASRGCPAPPRTASSPRACDARRPRRVRASSCPSKRETGLISPGFEPRCGGLVRSCLACDTSLPRRDLTGR